MSMTLVTLLQTSEGALTLSRTRVRAMSVSYDVDLCMALCPRTCYRITLELHPLLILKAPQGLQR